MGKRQTAIGTLVERWSRYVMLFPLPDGKNAEAVRVALEATVQRLPEHLWQSLTWDQGKEMAQHAQFTIDTGVQVYFCDPKSPWQRGSNENTNGPADLADSPKMPPRDVTVDVWTSDELVRFIEATQTDRLAAAWRLAAMFGLRRSELVGLQWPDIDLDGGWLSVRRSVVIVDGGPPIVKPPKTAKSRSTVELDRRTVSVLREWRRQHNSRSACVRARRGTRENGSWPTSSVRISGPTGSESDSSLFRERQG